MRDGQGQEEEKKDAEDVVAEEINLTEDSQLEQSPNPLRGGAALSNQYRYMQQSPAQPGFRNRE